VKTAKGELAQARDLDWMNDDFVFVVAAAENYPGTPNVGDPITGWQDWNNQTALLFFSGVKEREDELLTGGGRVLGVGSWGGTLNAARENAYLALKRISFRGMHFRKDIGL
jgi:phosphoribosylamine---glycine ligase